MQKRCYSTINTILFQVRFNTNQQSLKCSEQQKMKRTGRPEGTADSAKEGAFIKLTQYLESDDDSDGQYTGSKLMELMHSFLEEEQNGYTFRRLTQKLMDHYGTDIIVTSQPGKETIFTLLDIGNHILRDHHQDSSLSKEEIIDMAATIICDDIWSQIYDCTKYPKLSDMGNKDFVPDSLCRFIDGVIKTKAKVKSDCTERKRIAIAHAIIAASRPRSFISPILLGISTYINTCLESRELVDVLSS